MTTAEIKKLAPLFRRASKYPAQSTPQAAWDYIESWCLSSQHHWPYLPDHRAMSWAMLATLAEKGERP